MDEEKILFSFNWDEGIPSLEAIQEKFNISSEAIDEEFGVVEIDEIDKLYTIFVCKDALPDKFGVSTSIHSNPKIVPFNLEEE